MSSRQVKHLVIVGGGTAGWITAGLLARRLGGNVPNALKITLVESPNIPILGVGEGTWPTIRSTLQTLGVDESAFIRECDATFKQGSEFVNWVRPPVNGENSSYYHPLNAVYHAAYDFNLAPYWVLQQGDKSPFPRYDFAVSSQAQLCDTNRAPKKITTPAYTCIQNYSYHLDANKFAAFLNRHCVSQLGVNYVSANVQSVDLDEDGYIEAIQTDAHGRIRADFFVDCSGSKSVLLGQALGIGFVDIGDIIFNDSALAMQVPYTDPSNPIATHTIATAFEQGWTWDIGLSERRGVGFVYSSNYTDDETAERVLRSYVGDASRELDCRKLGFRSGYREKFWHKNCLAVGMSAAFIEPLEASAIFLVEAAVNMFSEQFPRNHQDMAYGERQFNKIYQMRWDKTIDFVKLHYCISQRRDSPYWVDNCSESSIPDSLSEKLEHWRYHSPTKFDFDQSFEPFVLDSYLFVLYGMEYLTNLEPAAYTFREHPEALRRFNDIAHSVKKLSQELPSQRKLIEQVHAHDFPLI